MQIAANIRQRNQAWQLVRPSERNLAAILAQFRRNERKSELLIDLLFRNACDPSFAGKQAVLVELPLVLVGHATQRDVVSLGAGEIEQRRSVALLRHRADIDLQAGAQHHRRAGRSVGKDLRDVFITYQFITDGGAILRRHQNVEIADRIAAPAKAAGHDHAPAIA